MIILCAYQCSFIERDLIITSSTTSLQSLVFEGWFALFFRWQATVESIKMRLWRFFSGYRQKYPLQEKILEGAIKHIDKFAKNYLSVFISALCPSRRRLQAFQPLQRSRG